ncbi:MAG: hypothetical protein IJH12_09345 [Clostridia bacterium]|nr:hypothetical protein [Clostridia bacterium]
MDKRQEVELIDLLEDIVGELSGSYVTGTGKDGIPKRLFQVNDYLSGKKTDAKECIFTLNQLKVIVGNERAKTIIEKVLNVYNKRIELSKKLQSRIYGCYSQKIPVNGDIERANFEIESYERINYLNQEHFSHMMNQRCTCDEYITIIENHINGLNNVYLKELEEWVKEFERVHNANIVIKPELISKYFGSMESNRIGSNIRKQEAVNQVYKEYGSFLDKMDKGTIAAQNKEFFPQKILGYKLQYLITKTKIVDAINVCMKNIETDMSSKKISQKIKKKNDAVIKKALAEIKELANEYRTIIKEMKSQNKEDAKVIKKNQKRQKLLNAGKQITVKETTEPVLTENELIKKFIVEELGVPQIYLANPVVYDAIFEYIQCFKESNHESDEMKVKNFDTIRQGLAFLEMPEGIKFEYDRKGNTKLKQAIEIKMNDDGLCIIRENEESPDAEKVSAKSTKQMPKIYVHTDSRIYDKSTNIEMSRIFKRAKLANNSRVEEESCQNIYKRDMKNMHFVYKNNEKKPLDLSITLEDIATLDGAVRSTYALSESSRQTMIRAIVNSRMVEAKEKCKMDKARGIKTNVPKEADVYAQVQKDVEESTIIKKLQESKYSEGFYKYPQYRIMCGKN